MSSKTNIKEKNNTKKLCIFLAFFIPLTVALIALYSGGFAPFGKRDVLTSGGFEKYRYLLNDLHDRLRDGASSNSGLISAQGYDSGSAWAYYLSDPTNLLTVLFPKEDMSAVLNILYAFKLALAGLFFYIFLCSRKRYEEEAKLANEKERSGIISIYNEKKNARKTKKLIEKYGAENAEAHRFDVRFGGSENPSSKLGQFLKKFDILSLALSVTYALSAYMMGSGLNVTLLGPVVIFPLIMLGLLKLINEGKWTLYCVAFALSFYLNIYITIIIFIFTFFYFLLQEYKCVKHMLVSFLYKLLADILAIGAASVIVISSLNSLLMKNMLSLEFPKSQVKVKIFDVFKCQLAGIGTDAANGNAHGIAIYAGIFVMFVFLLYGMNGNIRLNRRIKMLSLTAVLYVATFQSILNYFLNGFYYTETNSTFFGFILIFMLLTLADTVFVNLEHQRGVTVVISFVTVLLVIFLALLKSSNYTTMSPFLTSFELTVVYFTILIVYRTESMTKIAFKTCLGLLMLAEISVSFISGFKSIGGRTGRYAATDVAKYEAAEDYIHSMDANAKIYTFISGNSSSNPVTNMLAGYDYIIAKKTANRIDSMLELVDTYGEINIYKNNYSIHNGFFVNDKIMDMSFNDEEVFTSLNVLCEEVIKTKEPFHPISGDFFLANVERYDLKGKNISNNQYQVYFTPDESGDLYTSILGTLIHVGDAEQGVELDFPYDLHYKPSLFKKTTFQFATINENDIVDIYNNIIKNNAISDVSGENGVIINAPSSGYVMMPVSDLLWSASDKDVKYIYFLDTAYMIVPVSEGVNSFSVYHSSVAVVGVIISVIFISLIVLASIVSAKKKNEIYNDKAVIGLSGFASRNRVYILSIAISTLLFLLMLFIRSTTPFGEGYFLAHDGMAQTYPFLTGFYHSLFSGNMTLMNYHVGTGIDNFIASFPFLIFPFGYILAPFSLENVQIGFTIMGYVMFVLPGVSIIFYLTHRPSGKTLPKNDMRLLPLSLAYGLSSFAVSYISHIGFVNMMILFPLMIYSFENLVYNRKWKLYIFLLTYLMLEGIYYAFIISEFIFLYYMCLDHKNFKEFILKGLRVLAYSVVSAVLAAIVIIPYYISITLSPYQGNDSEMPSIFFTSDFFKIFNYIKPGAEAITVTTDFWKVNVYCGLLTFLVIPLYALNKKINLSIRIRKMVLASFMFLAFGNPLLNYILHGFHVQIMVPNRFSMYLIFLLTTMFFDCIIHEEGKLDKKKFIITTVWGASLSAIWLINNGFNDLSTIVSVIFTAAYLVILFLYERKIGRKMFYKLISILLIAEISYATINYTNYNTYGNHLSNEADYYGLASEMVSRNGIDKNLVRTGYFSRLRNTAIFINTNDVSVFASTLTKNHIDFIDKMGMSVPDLTNYIEYTLTNPLVDLFLNVQYHLINEYGDDNLTYNYMEEVDKDLNLTLYKNPYTSGFGFYIDKDNPIITLDEQGELIHEGNVIAAHNKLSNALVGQDLYTEIKLEDDPSKITDESTYIMTELKDLDDDTIEDPKAHVLVRLGKNVRGNVYLNFGYFSYLTLKETDEPYEMVFDIDDDQYYYYSGNTFRIAVLNEDTLAKITEVFKQSVMTDIETGFNTITGNIYSPGEGYTYISLPYLEGWSAEVDGKKVEMVKLLEGIGIPVSVGQHTIKLTYVTPGLKSGILVSLISLIILIIYIITLKLRSRAKKAITEASDDISDDEAVTDIEETVSNTAAGTNT